MLDIKIITDIDTRPGNSTDERPGSNSEPDEISGGSPGGDTDSDDDDDDDDRREGDDYERTEQEDDFVAFVKRLLARFNVYQNFNSIFTRSKLFTE